MRRTLFLFGLLVELIAIFGLLIPPMLLRQSGEVITLRTVPVDPRSIFRGDYVILSYEAAQRLPQNLDYSRPVFIVLRKSGETYERTRHTQEQPILAAGEVCIRGAPTWQGAELPDIAQYFVPEGTGHELENAQNSHRLLVSVAVNAKCKAVIMSLTMGPQAPLPPEPEIPGMMEEKPIPPPVL